MSIGDIAKAVAPEAKHKVIGIRPGEKLHEQMIGVEDTPYTYEYDEYFKILASHSQLEPGSGQNQWRLPSS